MLQILLRWKIRYKLLFLVIVTNLMLGIFLSYISLSSLRLSLKSEKSNSLKQIELQIKTNLTAFSEKISALIHSTADGIAAKSAFIDLHRGYSKLSEEKNVSEKSLDNELMDNYEKQYLNFVNYELPNSKQRSNSISYLPSDLNGKIAQKVFILDNPYMIGDKKKLSAPIGDVSSYSQAHSKWHATYLSMLENFQLSDIFMIDLDGNIFYTTAKEKDFATNLFRSPYKDSGLSYAFKQASQAEPGKIFFSDIAPYEPSLNQFLGFVSTPIYDKGQKIGVLVYQIDLTQKIRSIISESTAKDSVLGYTGEVYLVGPDLKMRNNVRYIDKIQDPLVQQQKNTTGLVKVDSSFVRYALAGESGVQWGQDYRGVKVLSTYSPIDILGIKWALLIEVAQEELFKEISKAWIKFLGTLLLGVGIVCGVSWYGIRLIIDLPLTSLFSKIKMSNSQLADGTDNQELLLNSSEDEITLISLQFNHFLKKLRGMVEMIKNSSESVSKKSHTGLESEKKIQAISTEQITAIRETLSCMEDTVSLNQSIVKVVGDISAKTQFAFEKVERGVDLVNKTLHKIKNVKDANENTITGIKHLNEDITSIWDILNAITTIADQTRLIAFNAELEASSAGEAGKNFQIVAMEIRRLADTVVHATTEISDKITKVQQSSDKLILCAENQTGQIQENWDLSNSLQEVFGDVKVISQESVQSAAQIKASVNQQNLTSQHVLTTLNSLSCKIEELANIVSISVEDSQLLVRVIDDLQEIAELCEV